MSFFWTAFRQALAGRLSDWRTWALLCLLPLAVFGAVRLMPPEEAAAPVQVGVALPEEGGEVFWNKLRARSGLVVTFLACDPRQAERQVSLGRWDCALILPEDFEERLAQGETAELFTLMVGPGSTVYPMVRETAAACAAECLSPGMAEDYLLDSGILDETGIEAARPRLQETLEERDRVQVTMETVDGKALDPLGLADSGVFRVVAGLIALALLAWALFTAVDLRRWLGSPFARRLAPLRSAGSLLLPRLAAALVPALCAGGLALLAAGC